jgi:hypothetical protein
VPASSVMVPANNTSTAFSATAGNMSSNQSATLTASLNGASRTASINLAASRSMTLSSLTCNPTSLNAGAITTCTVALSGAAPNGGTVVSLASNSNLLPVPPSVTVQANRNAATFVATAGLIDQSQGAMLTATLSGTSQQFGIDLLAGAAPFSLTCSPSIIAPGTSTVCSVNLSQVAPAGGITVALASNNSVLTLPPSVTVAAGSSSATFSVTVSTTVAQLTRLRQRVKILASFGGWSASAFVTIQLQRGRPRHNN